jgi:hypothetical protein
MKEIKAEPPSKPIQMGRVTYRVLTNEEARQKYGTSFVFVGGAPKPPAKPANVENEEDPAKK